LSVFEQKPIRPAFLEPPDHLLEAERSALHLGHDALQPLHRCLELCGAASASGFAVDFLAAMVHLPVPGPSSAS